MMMKSLSDIYKPLGGIFFSIFLFFVACAGLDESEDKKESV